VLVIGAILGRNSRHTILCLSLSDCWHQCFATLLECVATLAISTVAQFAEYAKPCARALETASAGPVITQLRRSGEWRGPLCGRRGLLGTRVVGVIKPRGGKTQATPELNLTINSLPQCIWRLHSPIQQIECDLSSKLPA
jgi:hypothetical protein